MDTTRKILDKNMLFRVSHTNGDIIKGFPTMPSAEADAVDRNKRALDLGSRARYIAIDCIASRLIANML